MNLSDNRYCPQCGADWRAGQIPVESVAEGYSGHEAPCEKKREWDKGWNPETPCTCPPRYFSHLIGVEFPYDHPEHYDGVSQWMCPFCGTRWNRWTLDEVNDDEKDQVS